MKLSLHILFSALCLAQTGLRALENGPETAPLSQCITQAKQVRAFYSAAIPTPLLALDRKLVHMTAGIPFLEANLSWLDQHGASSQSNPFSEFLAYNAAESCAQFVDQYRSHFRQFAALLISLVVLLLSLTVRAFLYMYAPQKGKAAVVHDKPANSDQDSNFNSSHRPS